jgi:N-acetylmuramoyl-L-alanine amidase
VSTIFKRFGLIFFILVIVFITFVFFTEGEKNEPPARVEKKEKASQLITAKPKRKSLIICIDPGHQQKADLSTEQIGPGSNLQKPKVTGGTQGISTGKPEYKLTLEASVILGKILEKKGFKVVYTRTTNDVNLSNKERAEIANRNKAALFIRIHADGSTNRNIRGFSILTPSSKNPYTQKIYKDSLKASQLILDDVMEDNDVKVNGISVRDDLSGTNWSHVPAILIEMGYMTNPIEDKNLSNQKYITHLMGEVSRGIADFVSYKKGPKD